MGEAVFPLCCLTLDQTMAGVMCIMATSFQRTCARIVVFSAPTLKQATVDPRLCQRFLDTHRQVGLDLLWDHCSFLLGLGVRKILLVPSKSLFPQSCVSSVITSPTGLQSQIPWGFSVSLPDPQVGKSVVGPRTFLTV